MMRRNVRMKRDVFLADIGTLPADYGNPQRHAAILRVHDVEEHAVALRVLRAMHGT